MDNQDHRKTTLVSGHESHGVHLCNKCGWPFPNPHPSARHRRAHKRVCGTIEGYKLVDSGETNHGATSDDDHLSDEDHKTPIPKVEEGITNVKNIAGIGAVSNRSEDEVFSDAPAEFPDSVFSPGSLDSPKNASNPAMVIDKVSGKDLSPNPSFKDCADTDNIQSLESSIDRSQMPNPGYQESLATLSGRMLESQDHASSSTDGSEQSKNITLSVGMTECSMLVGQETEAKGNKEISLGTNLLDDVVSPIKDAGETSGQASKSEKSLNVASDTVLTDGIVQLEEDFRQVSNMSVSGQTRTEIDEKGNPRIDVEGNLMGAVISQSEHVNITRDTVLKAEKKDEVTSLVELADEVIQVKEVPQSVLASNVAAGDFSPDAEPTEHSSDFVDTAQIKVDATQTTDYDEKGYTVESVHVLSVPDDIPIVDHAEIMLKDFKDHKRVHLHQSVPSASGEIIKDGEDETPDFISESRKLRESVNVSASDVHVLEDSSKNEDWSKSMVKEDVGGEDVLQVNVGSDKMGGSNTTEIEKDHRACSPEERQLSNTCDDLRREACSGTVAPADSEINQIANIVPTDDAAEHEMAETGVCNIAFSDDGRKVDRECSVESMINSLESASNLSISRVNPVSGILEGGDHGKGETEDFDINEAESGEGQRNENLSRKTNSISELTSNHQENQVVVEDVNDGSLGKLQEKDSKHLDEVSKIPEDVNEHEMNGSGKLQGDCAAEVPQAIESDNGGGGGLDFQKTSKGQTKTELPSVGHTEQEPSFPVDVEPTIQILAPVENNNSMASGGASSGVGSYSFQGETGESFVKHKLDATAVDISVESSSQADSLEGNWGSFLSVLSTPSDIPTGIDTDALPSADSQPSTEAEKGDANKPKGASERQYSDKSDVFEPPSFMTLVEPGADGQTAAACEVEAGNNPEQLKTSAMQAGWFPSLTHVSNESQGRKKNEEIMAKVTNWNMKQHTPLKNLLSEASVENKPNSPNPKDNPATVIQRDEKVVKDNVTSPMKVSSILGHEAPVGEAAMTEAAKEWNSPARYPAGIKREKRKMKGRPYWVQFVCCSSVN